MDVVAYARISQDREGAGLGVGRQLDDCRQLAARLGLAEPEELSDNDLSAYSGKARPGYRLLLDGLRAGRWHTLLYWHADRLHRSPKELEQFIDVIETAGVELHAVRGGRLDLESAEGRLQARIAGSIARYESEHRADRIRSAKAAKAAQGRHLGGPRVFGFEVDGTTHRPAEAAIIRELTTRVIAGESVKSLAADLRSRSVPTPRGGVWTSSAVRELVIRPRNAGLREHRGEVLAVEAAWSPIVDLDQLEAARALVTDPARRTTPGSATRWLLSGLATCGRCHTTVRVHSRQFADGKRPLYRCLPGHIGVPVALADEVVVRTTLRYLEREGVARPSARHVDAEARQRADAIRVRLAKLEDLLADGDLTQTGYRRNRDRLQGRLDEVERSMALEAVPGPLENVTPAVWGALPLERRRAVIDHLWTVTLHPGIAGPDSVEVALKL